MKSKRLLLVGSIFLVMLVAVLIFIAQPQPEPKDEVAPAPPAREPTVIEAVTWLPVDFVASKHARLFAEEIKKRSNGQLIIDIIGAGEVIPTEEQVFALKEGRIDMIFSAGDDIAHASPIGFAMVLTGMEPWEAREAGIWDFYREILARDINAYWLGSLIHPQWWCIYTNVRVESPDDMKGLKIRSGATHFGSVRAVGAEPISVPMMEIYTAMERGMIDGFVFPPCGWTQFGWQEVTKYWVGPRLVYSNNSTPLINLDVWNALTKEEQDLLTQTIIDMEREMWDLHYWIWTGEEYGEQSIINAGVERIQWTAEEDKRFQEMWMDALWEYVEGKLTAEDFSRFKELVGR